MAADLNLTRPKREVTEKKKKTGWCCQTVPWDTRFVYRRKEKKYVKLRFVCATSWSQKSERNQQIKKAQWLLEQNKNDRNGEPMETTRANSNQEKKNSLCICLWNCKSDLLLFFWTKCFRHQKEISKRIWDFEHESTNAKTAAQSVKKKKDDVKQHSKNEKKKRTPLCYKKTLYTLHWCLDALKRRRNSADGGKYTCVCEKLKTKWRPKCLRKRLLKICYSMQLRNRRAENTRKKRRKKKRRQCPLFLRVCFRTFCQRGWKTSQPIQKPLVANASELNPNNLQQITDCRHKGARLKQE